MAVDRSELKNVKAAGVLIIQDGKVLAFQKHGDDGLSFPCGKLHERENPRAGAEREASEELGCVVKVYDFVPMYLSVDDKQNTVYFFMAYIESGEPQPTAEGTPHWVEPNALLTGEYPEYNRRMLEFFGHVQ